jgi:hypothetical protein
MAILENIHVNMVKITPEEISQYLDNDYSQRSDFIADVLSFDKSRGEDNTTPREPGTLGMKGLIDANTFWTSRTSATNGVTEGPGMGALGSNCVLMINGYNGGPPGQNSTIKFSDTANTWTTRTNSNYSRYYNVVGNLSADLLINAGGSNGTERYSDAGNSYVIRNTSSAGIMRNFFSSLTNDLILAYGSTTNLFSDSANNWTSKTAMANARETYSFGAASLNSDLCYSISGGPSPSTINERYSRAMDKWITRNSSPYSIYGHSILSSTSDLIYIAGGLNNTYTIQFSDSMNNYIYKAHMINGSHYTAGCSFTSANSFMPCGNENSTATQRFTNNAVAQLSSIEFMSQAVNDSPIVPDISASQQIKTKTLRTTIPSKMIVGGLYSQLDQSLKPTADISGDGGSTWPVIGKPFDQVIDCSSVSGTDLRIRINLPRASGYKIKDGDLIGANTWTTRGSFSFARMMGASTSFTNDLSLFFGGSNLNNLGYANSDLFSQTANAWTSKTNCLYAVRGKAPGGFTSDLSLGSCGYNNVGFGQVLTERFSLAANLWIARTSANTATYNPGSGTLTSDLLFILASTSQRYADSLNAWTNMSSSGVTNRGNTFGAAYTTDLVLVPGGGNTVENSRFTNSTNTWSLRLNFPVSQTEIGGAALNTDAVIEQGGYVAGSYQDSSSRKFSDSANIWINRSRANLIYSDSSGNNVNSNSIFMAGGCDSSYTVISYSERYNDGETYMKGFALKYV